MEKIIIVSSGKRGVTNTQMIPALKSLIADGNFEKIKELKVDHPEVLSSSIKYLSKDVKAKLFESIEPEFFEIDIPKFGDEEIIKPGKHGFTNKQMLESVRTALLADNEKKLKMLKSNFPILYASATHYLNKAEKTKEVALLGES
jgi:hypothetical protein